MNYLSQIIATPPKFNIAPEKWWLEDYFPIGKVTFQRRTVKLWEGNYSVPHSWEDFCFCLEWHLVRCKLSFGECTHYKHIWKTLENLLN